MMVCPDCQRLRTPTGLHICLKAALAVRGPTVAATPASGPRSTRSDLRRVGTIILPGSDAVARIWNAVVEGNRT